VEDNLYLILDLSFDPAEENQTVIDKKIDEKTKFWAQNLDHFKDGTKYAKYYKMKDKIKEKMKDPNERKKEAKAAKEHECKELMKNLDIICINGKITEEEIKKITEQHKLSNITINEIIKQKNIIISKENEINPEILNNYKSKPKNTHTFESDSNYLKYFNKNNYYEFLECNKEENIENIRSKINSKKEKYVNQHTAESSSGSKICKACEDVFKSKDSKKIYDEYLEWSKIKTILNRAKRISIIKGGILHKEQGNLFIDQINESLKNRTQAENLFYSFCIAERITYISSSILKEKINVKICKCGFFNDVSNGRDTCENCFKKLVIKCPICNVENDGNAKVCKKCGFSYQIIDKVETSCELAQICIEELNFDYAWAHLRDAKSYLPGNTNVKEMGDKLERTKKKIGDRLEFLKNVVKNKRYYEAKICYTDIQKLYPKFKDTKLEDEIRVAIEETGYFYEKAKSQDNEILILENCRKALDICCDFPGLNELTLRYPPKKPTDLNIFADVFNQNNRLTWNKSTSEGIERYLLFRKCISLDNTNTSNNWELLKSIEECNFIDQNIQPAVSYSYKIIAERAGVCSEALISTKPIENLFEIKDVTVESKDSSLELKWNSHPASTVRLFKISDNEKEEEKPIICGSTSYLDSGLENEKKYNYLLRLGYTIDGQQKMTKGISICGIPTKPLKPIENLTVETEGDNKFTVKWGNQNQSEVFLYYSNSLPIYKFGQQIKKSKFDLDMCRIYVNKIADNSGTFELREDQKVYIAAVVIKNDIVFCGDVVPVYNRKSVKITYVSSVNGKINILIENLPQLAKNFVVLYRFDKFAKGMNDKEAVRKDIPIKQYMDDKALIINDSRSETYYFSVFVEFKEGDNVDYSIPSNYVFVNKSKEIITCEISVGKKYYVGKNILKMVFSSKNKSFTLPDIDIFSTVGNIPNYKPSSKLFYSIQTQPVVDKLHVEIPIPKEIESNTYIKPFLKNESLQSLYQLQLHCNSNPKIS